MVCAMTVRSAPAAPTGSLGPKDQEIKFCRAPDGVRLAYAIHGSGPVLVVASCWLSHLQYDWQSPVWRHFLDQLGSLATVVRYDERGFGLSDWTVDDFSLGARLADLEAIVAAAGLERFAVLGMSGGSAVALSYAIAHPDRVSRLILNGTVCGEPVAVCSRRARRGGDVSEDDPRSAGRRRIRRSGGCSRRGSSPTRPRSRCAGSTTSSGCRRRRPTPWPAASPASRSTSRTTCPGSPPRRSCSSRSATGRRRSTTPSPCPP